MNEKWMLINELRELKSIVEFALESCSCFYCYLVTHHHIHPIVGKELDTVKTKQKSVDKFWSISSVKCPWWTLHGLVYYPGWLGTNQLLLLKLSKILKNKFLMCQKYKWSSQAQYLHYLVWCWIVIFTQLLFVMLNYYFYCRTLKNNKIK